MSFCTVVNCMDGRVQLPVLTFLKERFNVQFVDNVTEPGPVLILAERKNSSLLKSILKRIQISVERHGSNGIAVVAHHDCAGNPRSKQIQLDQLKEAISFLKTHFKDIEIVGLWVNAKWQVEEIN